MIKKTKRDEFKRLFWDIETSYNVVRSWNIGYDLTITHENIIKERAIICICYKWAGEKEVHHFQWDKGDDKAMLKKFLEVLNSADEIIGHNSDRFDEKWMRTRCVYHRLPMMPTYQTIDTLKLAKSGFRFNSNRLDYLGKFLGFGGKIETGFKLWEAIVEHNDQTAMDKMVKYCKGDVILLEKIYNVLNPYTKPRTHVGVRMGLDSCSCPNCGSDHTHISKDIISAQGIHKKQMTCNDCGKYFTASLRAYLNREKERLNANKTNDQLNIKSK